MDYGDKQMLIAIRACAEEGHEASIRDLQERMDKARKAVDDNPQDAQAWYNLGMHCCYGTADDNDEDFECFKKAAELGSVDAMYRMAGYYIGEECRGEKEEWLGRAAEEELRIKN